jgi:hypothetical protein
MNWFCKHELGPKFQQYLSQGNLVSSLNLKLVLVLLESDLSLVLVLLESDLSQEGRMLGVSIT